MFLYFPLAIKAISRLSAVGHLQHGGTGRPSWDRSKDAKIDHRDKLLRHLMGSGEIDPTTGELHDIAVAWRALANAELAEERRLGHATPE